MFYPATLFGASRLVSAVLLSGVISISQASDDGELVSLTLGGSVGTPTVIGNTISWPDDGWYQVQDSLTYESLCQGGTSCTVDPGTYIVINHTTGRRYTDIVVGGTSGTESPVVEGQTIRWPNDGWYQVQNAETYESFCEGERSCTVDPGNYIVINHTTGRRFEDVLVESADGSGSNGSVTVDGDTIRWPDDGWYQVQNATTYESLCEGGSSCTVSSGIYTVINLTTGQRFSDIEVDIEGSNQNDWPDQIAVFGNTIRLPDDGWYQVLDATSFTSLCEGVRGCTVSPGRYLVINLSTGERFKPVTVAVTVPSGLIASVEVDSLLQDAKWATNAKWLMPFIGFAYLGDDRLGNILSATPVAIFEDGIEIFDCPLEGNVVRYYTGLENDYWHAGYLFDNCSAPGFVASGSMTRDLDLWGGRRDTGVDIAIGLENFSIAFDSGLQLAFSSASINYSDQTSGGFPCTGNTTAKIDMQLYDGVIAESGRKVIVELAQHVSEDREAICDSVRTYSETADMYLRFPGTGDAIARVRSMVSDTGTVDTDLRAGSMSIQYSPGELIELFSLGALDGTAQREITSDDKSVVEEIVHSFVPCEHCFYKPWRD